MSRPRAGRKPPGMVVLGVGAAYAAPLARWRARSPAGRGWSCRRGAARAQGGGPAAEPRPFVLEPAELPFDRAARPVERLPPQRPARDEGVQPTGPNPTCWPEHSPEGRRHLAAQRLASAPANVQVPCSQVAGLCLPALTAGVWRSGMTGWQSRSSPRLDPAPRSPSWTWATTHETQFVPTASTGC
jgi:hypothetical protein